MMRMLAVGISVVTLAAIVMALLGDWRWAIVAMMICLILIPGVMAILYFRYALDPGVFFNGLTHKLSVGDGMLRVHLIYSLKDGDEESSDEKTNDSADMGEESKTSAEELTGKRIIEWPLDRVEGYDILLTSVVFKLGRDEERKGSGGWIWLPQSAFAGKGEFEKFVKTVMRKC